jgi:rod shape-determining protein MreD
MMLFHTITPGWRLNFLIPGLILTFYKHNFITSLWASFTVGLILDLMAVEIQFGLYAINYCITTWILYRQKRNFFEDYLSTIPVMTFFFSVISTSIQLVLLQAFGNGIPISWQWMACDMVVMPACDALYAFAFFTLPLFASKFRLRQEYEA